MKRVIFLVFILNYVNPSNSRLIEKVPEAKTTTVSHNSTFPLRSKRHFIDDSPAFQEKAEPFLNAFEKKSKSVLNNQRILKETNTRVPRQSNVTKIEEIASVDTDKKVLVKKPIPKFNDLDDYYIEPKNYKIARFVESDENEDEDFNLDDYDFDVKHDEYVSRGKPSVPRKDDNATIDAPSENIKVVRTIDTSFDDKFNVTKQRLHKIEGKKDELYDDDAGTTIIKKVEGKDSEESTEADRSSVRAVRSASFKKDVFFESPMRTAAKRPFMLPLFPLLSEAATERDTRKDIM